MCGGEGMTKERAVVRGEGEGPDRGKGSGPRRAWRPIPAYTLFDKGARCSVRGGRAARRNRGQGMGERERPLTSFL